MIVYMDLENLLKEKNISKISYVKPAIYSVHSLTTTVKIKCPELISQFLQNSVNFWIAHRMIY